METRSKMNLIGIISIILMIAAVLVFTGGCRDEETGEAQESSEQTIAADDGGESETETEATEEDTESSSEEEAEDAEAAGEAEIAEDGDEIETEEIEEAEEAVEIPQEIIAEIEEANNYFDEGLYAEAIKEYRNAQRAIEDSELPEDKKQELIESIEENHQQALDISEAARNHHSNSMNLSYEKRFEEAKAELEAALAIYPKYQTAIDALDSLEALMGLE